MRFPCKWWLAALAAALSIGIAAAEPGDGDGADEAREAALELYGTRCLDDVNDAVRARMLSDWKILLTLGNSPESLLADAEQIPEDCDYISLRAALLAVRGEQASASASTKRRAQIREEEADAMAHPYRPCKHLDNCDEIIATRVGLRGLSQDYYDEYYFGMGAVVVGSGTALAAGGFALAAGIHSANRSQAAAESGRQLEEGDMTAVLFLMAGTLPFAIATSVAGTIAAISAGIVEPNRDRDVARSFARAPRVQMTVTVAPLGVFVRF